MGSFLQALRRHAVWAGMVGVAVPLLVLLLLQVRSLSTLKRTWALAHRTSLESCLAEVSAEVERELGTRAEHLLRVQAAAFQPDQAHLAARQFAAHSREGFGALYLYRVQPGAKGALLQFSPEEGKMVPAAAGPGAQ